jgi:thioredoxin-like negative regulator of GroEL
MAVDELPELDDATFADRVERPERGWVLVDFWAPWCQPCVTLAPVVSAVVAELEPRLVGYRADIANTPAVCDRLGVQTVPTLILFRAGAPVKRIFARRPRQLREELDRLMAD